MLAPDPGWRKGDILPGSVSNAVLRLIFALASAPAALAACGSATLDPDESRPAGAPDSPRPVSDEVSFRGVPLDAFASRLADSFCQALRGCCQANGFGAGPAACEEQVLADYQAQISNKLALDLRYQPLAAARCVAAFTRYVQGCSYHGRPASDAACAEVFQGTRALGENCERGAQCAKVSGSGVYCAGALGLHPHTCQRALAETEECLLEGCDDGLFCDFSRLTCVPQQTDGACLQFEACAPGTACSPNGTCDPTLPDGAACILDLQCQSNQCGDNGCAASFATRSSCASP